MTDRLATIVASKREEVEALRPRSEELRSRAEEAGPTRGFAEALRVPGEVRLLAEIKWRSPSAGLIREKAEPVAIAQAYQAGGAAALSVLTDAEYFGGSLAALEAVRAAVTIPILRKDFVIDPTQVWEARAAGADAILLIVRILEADQLKDLQTLAFDLGMDVLVEVHGAEELEAALQAGATLLGINNRDLRTFKTDLEISLGLAGTVDPQHTVVAESGIRTPEDVQRLGAAGVDAILVGESLMRQDDVGAAARSLSGHPRNPLVRKGLNQ